MQMLGNGTVINGHNGDATIQLQNPLGQGFFGVVFKAKDITNERLYAVKFPQAAIFGGGGGLTAFLNETQMAGQIKHPNVVDYVYTETRNVPFAPYIIMEFIEGGTLQDQIEKYENEGNFISHSNVQLWGLELIEAIAAINEKILHRDIKPDNILVDNGHLKISDFGISKIVDALTRTKTFKGGQQVFYMAPEAWKGETNRIQVDMYAVGIVLFQIISLQYPYNLPPDSNFQRMHLLAKPKPLSELRSELPQGVYQIVAKLLAKRPDDRFEAWQKVKAAWNKAWEKPASDNPNSLIDSISEKITKRYETATSLELEKQRQVEEEKEKEELDIYQQEELINLLDEVIKEISSKNPLGGITRVSVKERGILIYMLPSNAGKISIEFAKLSPPIKLENQKWNIRYVGFVKASRDRPNDETGFNFLLCRSSEDDLYGQWVVCEVRSNPTARSQRTSQPFGFDNVQQLQNELAISASAMHVYQLRFSDDIKMELLKLIEDRLSKK